MTAKTTNPSQKDTPPTPAYRPFKAGDRVEWRACNTKVNRVDGVVGKRVRGEVIRTEFREGLFLIVQKLYKSLVPLNYVPADRCKRL